MKPPCDIIRAESDGSAYAVDLTESLLIDQTPDIALVLAGDQTLLVPSAAVHPCGSVDLHDVQRTASTPPAGESWLGLNGEWVRR